MHSEDHRRLLDLALHQARLRYANKRYADAVSSYNEAVALLRKIGTKGELATCLMDRANCLYVISHEREAVRDYDEALPYLKKYGAPENHIACVMNRALCHFELGNTKKALKGFDEAIALFRRHQVEDGFARCAMYRAHCLNTLDRYQEAVGGYDEAASVARAAGLDDVLANCLRNRANCAYELGQKEEALASWDDALPLFRASGPRAFLEECLVNRATCRSQLGYFDTAIEDLDEVLPLLREHEPTPNLAQCMMIRALCLDQVGSEQDALGAYNDILAHYREHGSQDELADCLKTRSSYLRRRGYHAEALAGFNEVLRDFRPYLDRDDHAQCLMQKGNCLVQLGRGDEALACHDQALLGFREFGSKNDVADCLMNRAVCLHVIGQEEKALVEFDQAIGLYLECQNLADLGQCLMNLASCLDSLGRFKESLAAHDDALILLREHGDPVNVAGCLLNRADCIRKMRDAEDAFEAALGLNEALEIFQNHGTPGDVAQCLVSRANYLVLLNRVEDALDDLRDALPLLREHGRPDNVAGCLMNQGIYLGLLGKHREALNSHNMALPIFEANGTAGDIAKCLMERASCLASLQEWGEALETFDEAFAVEDRASTMLQDPTHRILARERTAERYRLATKLALDEEQPERAWGYAQRGKGRTLLDLLRVRAELTALDRQELLLVQQQESGQIDQEALTSGMQHIGNIRETQRAARLGKDPWVPMGLAEVVAVLGPDDVVLDYFTIDDDETLALFLLRPGQSTVSAVHRVAGPALQALTDRWEAARSTWLQAFHARAAVLASTDPGAIRYRDRVVAGHEATMATAAADEQEVLAELGDLVFGRVLAHLDESVTTLIVSPDGLLHRLPLAAVRVPDAAGQRQPMIDRVDLQLVPTASSLAILRGPHGPRLSWPAALLAAAPFATGEGRDDTRSLGTTAPVEAGGRSRFRAFWQRKPAKPEQTPAPEADRRDDREPSLAGFRDLGRGGEAPGLLPASGREIAAVADLLRAAGCPATIIPTAKATRTRLETELPMARILHLATHGEQLSAGESVIDYRIVLAGDTEIRVRELYDGGLLLKDVFLVNLSACSLGEVMRQGAEAVGFSQAFLQAGAGVVLAPLWAVNDEATTELMVRFYEELTLPEPPSVATAWGRACRRLRTETQYTHPIYWAGFLPSGDGRLRLDPSA